MKPYIKISDLASGEVIEREMTDEEAAQWQSDKLKAEAEAKAKAEKEIAKAALLEKLGITAEEAKLLLG